MVRVRKAGHCWCTRPSSAEFTTCDVCRSKKKVRNNRWAALSEDEKRMVARRANLRRHGITGEAYETMLAAQDGVCAICRQPCAHYRNLSIDHDHNCCPGPGACPECIRGLLCNNCNRALGMFKDDKTVLLAAVAYLERHEAKLEAAA